VAWAHDQEDNILVLNVFFGKNIKHRRCNNGNNHNPEVAVLTPGSGLSENSYTFTLPALTLGPRSPWSPRSPQRLRHPEAAQGYRPELPRPGQPHDQFHRET
jgi:hypothetical protein